MKGAMMAAALCSSAALLLAGEGKPPAGYAPKVAAQVYVYMQHYGREGSRIEDHLDDVLRDLKKGGYDAFEAWLNWFSSDASAKRVRSLLEEHKIRMVSAYTGGVFHTEEGAKSSIRGILEQARRARDAGCRIVDLNPDPKGGEKTDDELAIQARNLDRLGAELGKLGVTLALHHHSPEMRSEARELYHLLRNTDPKLVGFCIDLHWVLRGGGKPEAIMKDFADRTAAIHLRNSKDGVWTEDLGDGEVNHREIAGILRSAGYRGWLIVELAYEGGTKQTHSIGENLKVSREYVREVFGR